MTACIPVLLAGGLVGPARAVEPITPPACSTSTNGNFICAVDLDGSGKQQIVLGNMGEYNPAIGNIGNGYVYILSPTGAIKKQICWAQGASPTASCPPTVTQ